MCIQYPYDSVLLEMTESSESVLRTDLRSVSQQGPQRVRRQALRARKRQRVRLLPVESDVLAAMVITLQLLAAAQSHQIPRPHLSQDLPHGPHLPVRKVTCRGERQCERGDLFRRFYNTRFNPQGLRTSDGFSWHFSWRNKFDGNAHPRPKRASGRLISMLRSPP